MPILLIQFTGICNVGIYLGTTELQLVSTFQFGGNIHELFILVITHMEYSKFFEIVNY